METVLSHKKKSNKVVSANTKNKTMIIRVKGESFQKKEYLLGEPTNERFKEAMKTTATFLGKQVPYCKLVYVYFDEIILLIDRPFNSKIKTMLDYTEQEVVSLISSMAAARLNPKMMGVNRKREMFAFFKTEIKTIEPDDISNYFISKEAESIEHSIKTIAFHNLDYILYARKDTDTLKQLLKDKMNIEWDALDIHFKKGTYITKIPYKVKGVNKSKWRINKGVRNAILNDKDFFKKL